MKKIILTTALLFTSMLAVSAEKMLTEGNVEGVHTGLRSRMMDTGTRPVIATTTRKDVLKPGRTPGGEVPVMSMPIPATGDSATDAQLKVLSQEMQTKIKALTDEYQVMMKAAMKDSSSLQNGGGGDNEQVKALTRELQVKIKAITDSYQPKFNAIFGDKNVMIPSPVVTHPTMIAPGKGDGKIGRPMMASTTDGSVPPAPRMKEGEMKGLRNVATSTSTEKKPENGGSTFGFFRGLFR